MLGGAEGHLKETNWGLNSAFERFSLTKTAGGSVNSENTFDLELPIPSNYLMGDR